jgi:hypothetical protein
MIDIFASTKIMVFTRIFDGWNVNYGTVGLAVCG